MVKYFMIRFVERHWRPICRYGEYRHLCWFISEYFTIRNSGDNRVASLKYLDGKGYSRKQ